MSITRVHDGAVLRLGFDRLDRKNAITAAMYAALADGLEFAGAERTVRVVVLHGDASVFTAGNDLADFLKFKPSDDETPVLRFLRLISRFDKPLIAAVSGPAVGVGTTLLLHCDLVYASDTASFSLPFVNLGICPEAASTVLLPALAGYARAAEKLLFGEPFDAAEACAMGLVNRVLPVADLMTYVCARAAQLAERPIASLVQTKRLMRAPLAAQVAASMADESRTFGRMLTEPAAREAFSAFMQKRRPDFSSID